MIIAHNLAAMSALHETNKNNNKLEKALKQASSGMKLNSAGDDSSGYAISERMRVRLRSLNQDEQNVKNGTSMLNIASGAIQSQINLMRTIKAKVIDASNDSNTDTDRATIQKEINQYYKEIDDIAYDTNFNGVQLLVGSEVKETIKSWRVLDHVVEVEGSDTLGILTNAFDSSYYNSAVYDKLDNEKGPFKIFKEYSQQVTTNKYTGYTQGTPDKYTVDFSGDFSGKGFYVSGNGYYVIRTDSSITYPSYMNVIDVLPSATSAEVATAVKAKLNNPSYFTSAVSGNTVVFSTKLSSYDNYDDNRSRYVEGSSASASSGSSGTPSKTVPGSSLPTTYLSGGAEAHGKGDADSPFVPATTASAVVNVPPANTGITLHRTSYSYTSIKFVTGNAAPSTVDGCYTVGVNYTGSISSPSGMSATMSGGKITLTATSPGSSGNNYYISYGGFSYGGSSSSSAHAAVSSASVSKTAGVAGEKGTYVLDLSAYTDVEDLIDAWKGKALKQNSSVYEFLDTGSSTPIDAFQKISTANVIDLNSIRLAVAGGASIASAFATVLDSKSGLNTTIIKNAADEITGISFKNPNTGSNNTEPLKIIDPDIRSCRLDFANLLANIPAGQSIPEALDNQGFRTYCATDPAQWFNFIFVNGSYADDRPASGGNGIDIKPMLIDVSQVTDAASLVQAVYDQTLPYLTGTNKNYNHFLRTFPDGDGLIIYDYRNYDVSDPKDYPNYQEKGAKIAGGIKDNVIMDKRDVYVKNLVIQHTDKANMNIRISIPQTTMDHILGYLKANNSMEDFNVLTKEMREKLLGVPPDKGLLDEGIEYLLDGQTLLGAQMSHMEHANDNIVTSAENLTAAESVIRDADMARTMTNFTKFNVLQQSAQAMLAQANQTPQSVLSLLQ